MEIGVHCETHFLSLGVFCYAMLQVCRVLQDLGRVDPSLFFFFLFLDGNILC